MEDREIVALYHARDETAIQETSRKYGRYCFAIAYRILRSAQDSEECVNDTWMRAWNAMPPKKPDVLSAFLGKITRNLSLDQYQASRAAKRGGGQVALALEELLDAAPVEDFSTRVIEDMELTELLNGFLAALPTRNRKIFMQRYWYLMSSKEIAAQQNMKESAVRMSLARSREKLKELMEQRGVAL